MSTVTIRADGTTLLDGKPFFPLGFFEVSDNRTPAQLQGDIAQMGQAGFNVLEFVASAKYTPLQTSQIFDTAAAQGVYLIPFVSRYLNLQAFVTAFKDKPAEFGWYIWDDVNATTDFAALRAKDALFASLDPGHVTTFSASATQLLRADDAGMTGGGLAGAVGAQIYPIGGGDGITAVHTEVGSAVALAARHGESPWANLQTFRWPGRRIPTFQEYRYMAYQAITAGAKGILNYAFFDDDNYLPSYTALWAGLQTMPAEIGRIQDYLLNGTRTELKLAPSVWAGVWQYQGKTLVIAVNGKTKTAVNVAIPLPAGVNGPAQAPFPNRPHSLSYSGGKLVGQLQPLDVQIYEFDGGLFPGQVDIGAPATAGASSYAGGVYTVRAGGRDIWYTADQFRFVYAALTGDGVITARLTGLDRASPWTKAGVMFRDSLDAGSVNAALLVTPDHGAIFQYRRNAGGASGHAPFVAPAAWLRLARTGDVFTGYTSADGLAWTLVGSMTVAMGRTAYVGLAVTSHNGSAVTTATFDSASVQSG